jgi:signal transduction histidine kinase
MINSTLTQRTDVSTMLLDSNLKVIYMSFYKKNEKEEVIKISEIEDILKSKKDYRTFIEGIATFREEKVPIIIKPVTWYLDNSRIIGYHIVFFDKEFLIRQYNNIALEEGSNIFITNDSGNLVSGINPTDTVGEDLSKKKEYLLQDKNKITNKITKDNLITFSNIAKTGWYLVSEIPISSLTRESRALGIFVVIIVIGCLLVAIVVSILLSKQIALPLANLVRNMREAEEGNLNTAIGIVYRNDEIGDVTRGFKNMIENIRMLIKSVEDQNIQLSEAFENLKKAQKIIIESEKMAALGKLVAGVAHEINTPIGVSITAASFLVSKSLSINEIFQSGKLKKNEFESYIVDCNDSASIILNDLTIASKIIQSFKQIAADQDEDEKRDFYVNEYLNGILTSMAPTLRRTNHSIDIKCDEELQILSYPGSIYMVISNLINNSISHGFQEKANGNIIIDVSKKGNDLILKYFDDGMGISTESLENIYEPFYTTKRGEGKIGLGLSIVYNIVSQILKGSISCESELGTGTNFTIIIPDVVN